MEPERPRLYLDEDISAIVAAKLRKLGYDILTTHQAGRCAASDASQLEFAAGLGRLLVTRNYADFQKLHEACLMEGKHHGGIVVCFWRPDAQVMLDRLVSLLDRHSSDWRDQLNYA
jgi:uncharacterized protein with PIN domain